MTKRFKEKELINRLGMDLDRAKMVMKAQKEFPELLESNAKYIGSFRNLYIKLGLDVSSYAKWVRRNIKNNTFFSENRDWWVLGQRTTTEKGGQKAEDYKVTIEMAKHLCMMSKTEKAHEIRNYFIYLEEAIKDMEDWYIVRNPQKQSYIKMTDVIKEQYIKENGKEPNRFIYVNNADMINLALFGYRSKQIRDILELEYDDLIRDNLVVECNKAIDELQILNTNLLISNVDFQTRKLIITNTCNAKFIGIRVKLVSEFSKELRQIS